MAIIAVVEDDPGIRTALIRALRERGHAVSASSTGLAALQSVTEQEPDLVVLDLGLPDIDGLRVLDMVRAVSRVPVIVVTARDDRRAVVEALDHGADDYVVKPFDADQLEARIRAVLRRSGEETGESSLRVGGLEIDPSGHTVRLEGSPVALTRKEFDLLHLLARRAGQVVTKREILAEVWREAYGGSERTVDVHLSWLRRKLGETAAQPRYLHSIRGVGVKLSPPGAA